jgi:hypothetical protein
MDRAGGLVPGGLVFALVDPRDYTTARWADHVWACLDSKFLRGLNMKKFAYAAFASAAVLALSACGSSDSASEQASPDNVEVPAEETVASAEPSAMPVPDNGAAPAAAASASAVATDAAAKVEDAAAAAAQAAQEFKDAGTSTTDAAEKAVDQAEKKM